MTDTKEYRMEIKVKNNLLYKKIYDTYGSVKSFCNAVNLSDQTIMKFLNFKCELYNKRDGELKDSVKKLLDIFKCPLNELFPENYKAVETNKHVKEVSQQEIEAISMQSPEMNLLSYNIDSEVEQDELRNRIEKVLDTLTPREAEAIRLRYLDGYTLEEAGKRIGASKTRAGQIVQKALKKMMHPSRSRFLKEYSEGRDIMTSMNAYDPQKLESLMREDELILLNTIKYIFTNILDIKHKSYKIDDKHFSSFELDSYYNVISTMSYGKYWYFPIEMSKENIMLKFVKKYKGECVKIIYNRRAYESDNQINSLFKKLINIFIDLCKDSYGAEITGDYIIMPRNEFRKLKDKVIELSNVING